MADFILKIKPAIPPARRHRLEDFLKGEGFDVIGGGTDTDMTSCDISFSSSPEEETGG